IFRHAVQRYGNFRVMSAGLGAMDGQPPSTYAVEAVRELGIDISNQRSRMLTPELVHHADYIFGMTHSHVDTVMMLYPMAAEKTFLLREFDETLDQFEKDISDPIGGSFEVYLNCRDQIEQGIVSLLRFIYHRQVQLRPTSGNPATIALGADHGGFHLKEAIRLHLEKRGVSAADFGAKSTESSDYTDFAHAVAQSVAHRRAEFGILVCTTGVGMSIAANKVPGVRAALVNDVDAAALARRHNNANILCLAGSTTTPEAAARIIDAFLTTSFEGGRHERRINKMETRIIPTDLRLQDVDQDIADTIVRDRQRLSW